VSKLVVILDYGQRATVPLNILRTATLMDDNALVVWSRYELVWDHLP
jgi:hypothetical protein